MSRFAKVACVITASLVVLSSCARSETLGPEEAIEVMVLDGVDRGRAICVIDSLAGRLDLAKVTGLDVHLSDDELALLSTTSSRCAPALGSGGGLAAGSGEGIDEVAIQADLDAAGADEQVQERVLSLMQDGLDPDEADCLLDVLRTQDAAPELLDDVFAVSSLIIDCREELSGTSR